MDYGIFKGPDGRTNFKYSYFWELEDADTVNNPDCIATLSHGDNNLINIVKFPTGTNLDDFKIVMEDMITDDGGVILSSDFVDIANKNAIKVHANIDLPEINFDIHSFVFIEHGQIIIMELRTADKSTTAIEEFCKIVESLEIL